MFDSSCYCVFLQWCLAISNSMDCACQAPLSIEFSTQEYKSGCHFLLQEIFLCWLSGKESACNAEDVGLIPELQRFPEGGASNPLQFLLTSRLI